MDRTLGPAEGEMNTGYRRTVDLLKNSNVLVFDDAEQLQSHSSVDIALMGIRPYIGLQQRCLQSTLGEIHMGDISREPRHRRDEGSVWLGPSQT